MTADAVVPALRRGFAVRLFEAGFLRAMFRSLGLPRARRRVLRREIIEGARTAWAEVGVPAADARALEHRWSACLVLGAERALAAAQVERQTRRRALEAGLVEPGRGAIRWFTRRLLDRSADPFAAIVDYSEQQVPPRYGASFRFRTHDRTAQRFEQRIDRCHFHDVLSDAGAPELTSLFCAYDSNWIDALDPEGDGLRFERPATLAAGDDACRFVFVREGDADERLPRGS